MLEPAQTALLLVIITLSILLLVLGFQTFFILREFKKTLTKTNKILDGVETGANFAKILGSLLVFLVGGKIGKDSLKNIAGFFAKKENSQKANLNGHKPTNGETPGRKIVRRFFKRKTA